VLALADKFTEVDWSKNGIAGAVKEILAEHKLKMGQFAPAVRLRIRISGCLCRRRTTCSNSPAIGVSRRIHERFEYCSTSA